MSNRYTRSQDSRSQRSRSQRTRSQRSAFTLLELLVVIAIIGILAALLTVTIGPLFVRTTTFQIETEVMQMDGAFEKFKSKFGFYPPDFCPDPSALSTNTIKSADEFLVYLDRISRTHGEREEPTPGSGIRRIDIWWLNVGQNLDRDSGIVFWLSGLKKDKQYPLTDPVTGDHVPAHSKQTDGLTALGYTNNWEREIFFEFEDGRLDFFQDDFLAHYHQPDADGESVYVYFHHSNYALTVGAPPFSAGDEQPFIRNPGANEQQVVPYTEPGTTLFFEPKRFQIVTAGADEFYAFPGSAFDTNITGNDERADNVTNFSNGTLEALALSLNAL